MCEKSIEPILLSRHIPGTGKDNSHLKGGPEGHQRILQRHHCAYSEMGEPGGKTLCAQIFLGVIEGSSFTPPKGHAGLKRNLPGAAAQQCCCKTPRGSPCSDWGHQRPLLCLCSLYCLKGCSSTLKPSSPSTYKVMGVEDRNPSALPSQKLLESPFHLIVLNYSLYWLFPPFDLLIVKHT